ncbi:hypothetical protein LZ198_02385 [Myxococcus sp. K15C18031901]|uniref:hypothetical protein n=1 Tax=Myxococcus dinghuensis TaxID=2906761 RepID=UPI0020A7650A|nr:hypothetical protein [Myxococcus dinghuensis]MCP3097720.1 hypothetical protein [Myxococcus dinghuensis]
MSRSHPLSFLAVLALLSCLYAGESHAQNAQGGVVNHGDFITVPYGTVGDWVLHVSPYRLGMEEPGSEGDNALLRIDCYVVQINQYTWQVVAQYKYRYSNAPHGTWYTGSANYMLVHK